MSQDAASAAAASASAAAAPVKAEPKSFARRDRLREIEINAQAQWEQDHSFEVDADQPTPLKQKFLATFPYPYMNGKLHLGHAFTMMKAELAVSYNRLKGKKVLFPFGFHCTGMPIAACADKLKREVARFGNPPQFPVVQVEEVEEEVADAPADAAAAAAAPADAKKEEKKDPKKKKGKLANKKSKEVYQWNIMKEMGVPESEIAKFQDANYWLRYFPPIAREDLKQFGMKIDFRRSFITTEINPYYDAFIRWQFNQLRKRDKIAFGNRPCIFSPIDDQACADHDRASGEGVGPQEYTIIKLRLLSPFPEKLAHLEGKEVILAAATLRPETMYGQTNCWVLPTGEYGAFEMSNGEVWVCSQRSALNMSYQNMTPVRGKPNCLAEFKGEDLLGAAIKAPQTSYERCYVLPLLSISMDKTTGVVTSVPSDAPDDYAALMDLKNKAPLRQKFNIADEKVLPFEIIPIIDVPGFGTVCAQEACTRLGIKSQNDRDKLAEAKELTYMKGFYEGVMLVGPYAGMKVHEAKPLIRADMIKAGTAAVYSEPESLVISRSGCECVVALTDQWYMKYGEEKWQAQVAEHVKKNLSTFSPVAQDKFEAAVAWLKEWACSRTYGLGTKLPWDPQFLIESLSDSTIYMAYYTIAHFLQEGDLEGTGAPHPVKPEQLTDEVFDYIFLNGNLPESCGISTELLEKMRKEFLFWYPLDLRVSGKDLIPNHLTMSLYNHAAIWEDPAMMPRGFFTNGHVMVDNQKMSKSLGNFLTMENCVAQYGVDATRLALADAGDSLEDANFSSDVANSAILRLTKEMDFILDSLETIDTLRTGAYNFWDNVFANDMNRIIRCADSAYERMQFRDALRFSLFDLSLRRDQYRVATSGSMHRDMIKRFAEVQLLLLSPICPHICEFLWSKIGKSGLIVNAKWPESAPEDVLLTRQATYLEYIAHELRVRHAGAEVSRVKRNAQAKKKSGDAPVYEEPVITTVSIFFAPEYPAWQKKTLLICAQEYNPEKKDFGNDLVKIVSQDAELKKKMKFIMPFVANLKIEAESRGPEVFELKLPFDEGVLLQEHLEFISRGLTLSSIQILPQDLEKNADEKEQCTPGKPLFKFA